MNSFDKIERWELENQKFKSRQHESILDSRRDIESLLVRIPSSRDIEKFKGKIVEMFNNSGVLIIEFSESEPSQEQLLCLRAIFGSTMTHDRADDNMIAEIAVSENFKGYLGTSNLAHPFHTDGAYDDKPPHAMALRCEVPAKEGGISQIVDGKAIYNHLLSKDKKIVEALFAPDALCVERAGKKSCQPIFKKEGDVIFMRYRSDNTSIFSQNPKVQEGIREIENFLANKKNYMAFTMKAKQVLIADNMRVLHARTAFPENEPRKMHRLFFSGDSSSKTGLTFGFSI